MPLSIPLTGLGADDPVPGIYSEILFARGPASSAANVYSVLLMGNKTSAGSATANTVIYGPDTAVPCSSEADVISLFGTGSELHRMALRFWAINKSTPLYFIAVAESAGTQATGTLTIATTATGAGTLRIWVGDEFCDTAITSGDTATVIADAAVLSINAKTAWPVTAANVAGVITLTAKLKGPRGNSIRYGSQIISQSSIATTSSPTAQTAMTTGATLDTWTTALTTILSQRYYYIVPAAEDGTSLGLVKAQIDSQALPITGIRQRMVAGCVDTIANAITLATGLNAARDEMPWMYLSDLTPAELAAHCAAAYSLGEAPVQFRLNWDFYGDGANDIWGVKPARSAGAVPTRAQIKSALNNGITPIETLGSRSTRIVSRVTTRSLNGATADYRIRDAHKVTVCDRYADAAATKIGALMAGKSIGDDPAVGGKPPGPTVLTPRVVKAALDRLTRDWAEGELDLLQNGDDIVDNTLVIREASPTTRMSARVPLQPVDIVHQVGLLYEQVA
jgi:phage tail sheath gpL-like